jgi:hypothetical protein
MRSRDIGHTSYPQEKLQDAVSGMAVTDRPLRERLADAMIYYLAYINAEDLPNGSMRHDLEGIQEDLSIVSSPDGNSILATARQLTDGDAQEIARRIFKLFIEVTHSNMPRVANRRADLFSSARSVRER